jgi:Fungal specific transcription factor domain
LINDLEALANRTAQLLNLPKENPADDEITREVKRRVWWSLYLIDRWASAGLGLPRHFHNGGPVPRIPMDEVMFSQLTVTDASSGVDDLNTWQPGIWSHMISLVKIFGHIQDLNHELVDQTHWDENSIESRVLSLAEQLASFEYELPSTMVYTLDNLDFHVRRGVGRIFVALHLGYHHYCTLLYYQYLDQRRPPTPNTRMFAQRCKHHATEYCELIRISNQHGGAEALYNIVGHMTVVSLSVLLHTLLLGDDHGLPMARHRLESNFEFLVKLREIWPSVDIMVSSKEPFELSRLTASS